MVNFKTLLILFTGYLLASCNPKYYSPNTQNVPLISEKGEKNLIISGNGNLVELQGSYGVSENIAININGGLYVPQDLDNGNGGSGKLIELGGGYFKSLSNHFVFETYGIVGLGSFENHLPSTIASYPQTKGDISANAFRIGIQPNFGYKTKYFSAAISSRFVNLSYSKIEGDLIFDNISQVAYLKDNASHLLIEPAITLRTGLDKIKLQLQYGYSINASNTDFKQDKGYLTLGLNFNFK